MYLGSVETNFGAWDGAASGAMSATEITCVLL